MFQTCKLGQSAVPFSFLVPCTLARLCLPLIPGAEHGSMPSLSRELRLSIGPFSTHRQASNQFIPTGPHRAPSTAPLREFSDPFSHRTTPSLQYARCPSGYAINLSSAEHASVDVVSPWCRHDAARSTTRVDRDVILPGLTRCPADRPAAPHKKRTTTNCCASSEQISFTPSPTHPSLLVRCHFIRHQPSVHATLRCVFDGGTTGARCGYRARLYLSTEIVPAFVYCGHC